MLAAALLLTACGAKTEDKSAATAPSAAATASTATNDDARLANDADGVNWMAYGRTYSETHGSPLAEINTSNVNKLGLEWSLDLGDIKNGATVPIAVDGILYFTVGQSFVHAVDARTGKLLWRFDPEVAKVAGHKLRYAWGPRGVAYWNNKVFVGTADGRLIGIDAKTGKQVWSQMTVDQESSANITGAPRVFDGKVVIGFGGAEFRKIRGYVTAYEADTGKQLWRFYAVPGNPADGFENKAMEMAAKTWTGEWWKMGGGGTIWNGITYDPELKQLYLGTGNGHPWNHKVRSPGGGDNLFLGSIVAVDANTGEYRWHHQQNPGNTWDYNSVMDMTIGTIQYEGQPKKVLMQLPKSGFFFILDRETGKLLSAEKVDKVTWADRFDLATGRPVETKDARYSDKMIWPGSGGLHSWMPWSWNQKLGLMFVPIQRSGSVAGKGPQNPELWQHQPIGFNIGYETTFDKVQPPRGGGVLSGGPPAGKPPEDEGASWLIGWNPSTQKEVWRTRTTDHWVGGTMTTDGDLVFQGQADGKFMAYDAKTGKPLWTYDARMGIAGAPITYSVDGKQYVTVVAGWGATGAAFMGMVTHVYGWQARVHPHRVLTFALEGKAELPPTPPPQEAVPIDDPTFVVDAAKAGKGAGLFMVACAPCHGGFAIAGGYAPDLRQSPIPLQAETFKQIVVGGALELNQMPKFEELTDEQLEQLRHFLRQSARTSLAMAKSKPAAK